MLDIAAPVVVDLAGRNNPAANGCRRFTGRVIRDDAGRYCGHIHREINPVAQRP